MSTSSLKSEILKIPVAFKYAIAILLSGIIGYISYSYGLIVLPAMLGLPVLAAFVIALFYRPQVGIFAGIILGFFMSFLSRHVIQVTYGIIVESIFLLVYLVLFLKHYKYLNFRLARTDVVLMFGIWMLYVIFELANPEVRSRVAWFYAMRGIALIQLLIIPLVLVLLNNKRGWKQFLYAWLALSLFALLWGMKQQYIGVTAAEQRWLDNGGHLTHILFGKLRVFSVHSDAGTFGSSMAHICLVCFILFLGPYSRKKKILFLILGMLFFYGLMLSGTRGALAIPAIGGFAYLVMVKNFRYIIIGGIVLAFGFSFLKFTTVGNSQYEIYRLRTALNPNDPSLQVRLENRERLTQYLKGKPFGGGLGSVGRMGSRFTPGTWLSNFPPDGLYTKIRAETGIVGKYLYLFVLIYILVRGILITWKLKSDEFRNIGMALLAGYAGILAANYGNEVMVLYPNNLFTFVSLGIVYSLQYWNKNGEPELKDELTPQEGALKPDTSWKNKDFG